jgi:hypothetical protein
MVQNVSVSVALYVLGVEDEAEAVTVPLDMMLKDNRVDSMTFFICCLPNVRFVTYLF